MPAKIHVPDVCERDIDLLLLEEFIASPEFQSWFLAEAGVDGPALLSEACRSVKTRSGESDLELAFDRPAGVLRVLVENKVDAPFQVDQAGRYAKRAAEYKAARGYEAVCTVIMAPEVYFGGEGKTFGFDAKVAYESVLAWFSAAERAGPRTDYKLTLLQAAIDRGRTGWQLIPHARVGEFWRSYWQLAEQIARQLSMPVPKDDIPAASHFIEFQPAALPAEVKLKHKVGYGHVDLEFRNMGERLNELERLYGANLPPGTRIERAAKSAVIRARVDPLDMTQADFIANEAVVRKGIQTAAMLLDWFTKQRPPESAT